MISENRKIIISIIIILSLLLFFLPPLDPDLGWHLKCGEALFQEGSFCGQNNFSVFLEDYSWPNHAWAYQGIIFPIFNFFGFFGLSLLNSIILFGMALLLFFSFRGRNLEKIFFIFIFFFFSWGVFSLGVRSQVIGIFFFVLEIFLLFKYKEKERIIFLFPLLFLIWANFHGSVIIGILFFGLFLFRETLLEKEKVVRNLIIFISSTFIILLNPFDFEIYLDSWRHFISANLGDIIAEWVPPNFWNMLVMLLVGLYVVFECLKKNKRKEVLLILFLFVFAYVSFVSKRNIPFYFLILFFVYFSLDKNTLFNKFFNNKFLEKLFLSLIVFILVIVVFFGFPSNLEASIDYGEWCSKSLDLNLNYPCGGVDFLNLKSPGKVFNAFEWGGFLIWKNPQNKVFVDGRMPAWETSSGKSPYLVYLETVQTQPGWENILEEYGVSYLFIGSGTFMDLEIHNNQEKYSWEEIYRDNFSVIYEKVI